jgi:IMP cyclohydrolase
MKGRSTMQSILKSNIDRLKSNQYPGRGIIIGLTPDSTQYVQVYWIMGRSENSRNRIFVLDSNNDVRNEAFDMDNLSDPSLIIYSPIRSLDRSHIVSNGDQTETIYESLSTNGSFEDAIQEREFEPDGPNYTPRISGIVDLRDTQNAYKLSIIKSLYNNPSVCVRNMFKYEKAFTGVGHCITTYMGDGTPLPSYEGEPVVVPLFNDIEETLDYYWKLLNEHNRISLLVKHIVIKTNQVCVRIQNKLVL